MSNYKPRNDISTEKIYWRSLIKSSPRYTVKDFSILLKIEEAEPKSNGESDSSFPWACSAAMHFYMIDQYERKGARFLKEMNELVKNCRRKNK